jgi:L-ascorbate metabolism protein UlaG (beta-lactamase superfamily)
MKITFLGHSAVYIETKDHNIVIDPFIAGNPVCPVGVDDLKPDFVVLTHAHGDHWGNTMDYAKRGAQVISSAEIVGYAIDQDGSVKGRGMNTGGRASFAFGSVKFTPAWHSSSFPDGSYGGLAMGVILEIEGKRIYHAGDTALFGDMKLIGAGGLDLAFVPIGDNFTMGPDDALQALELLRPKAVVPVHYNTFDLLKQDGDAFAVHAEAIGVRGHALKPGSSIEL